MSWLPEEAKHIYPWALLHLNIFFLSLPFFHWRRKLYFKGKKEKKTVVGIGTAHCCHLVEVGEVRRDGPITRVVRLNCLIVGSGVRACTHGFNLCRLFSTACTRSGTKASKIHSPHHTHPGIGPQFADSNGRRLTLWRVVGPWRKVFWSRGVWGRRWGRVGSSLITQPLSVLTRIVHFYCEYSLLLGSPPT